MKIHLPAIWNATLFDCVLRETWVSHGCFLARQRESFISLQTDTSQNVDLGTFCQFTQV